jgi:hypothetical protein
MSNLLIGRILSYEPGTLAAGPEWKFFPAVTQIPDRIQELASQAEV